MLPLPTYLFKFIANNLRAVGHPNINRVYHQTIRFHIHTKTQVILCRDENNGLCMASSEAVSLFHAVNRVILPPNKYA